MNDDDLKCLLLFLVELLTACDLFDQLLDDDLVVVVGLTGGHLDVIVGREDDALDRGGARGASLKFFELTLDLVNC